MLKRSWVETDLNRLCNNYLIFKEQIRADQNVMAVVKADGYGHGACRVAQKLQSAGCKNFAVACLDEAIALREAGISGQILILGYTPAIYAKELLAYNITQTLLSYDHACSFRDYRITAQFAIDTGMNRIGLDADHPVECEKIIRSFAAKFNLTGLFTHLCVADLPAENDFTENQIRKFRRIVENTSDLKFPCIHCMNSAGALWQQPYGNLVRLGIVLYGLKPDEKNVLPPGIKPVLQWKSIISSIRTILPGETVGYGRTFRASSEMRIATIPTGYADGYNRLLSNRGYVLIHGLKAPIAGRICMDQFMVNVTEIPEAAFEDEVVLLGDEFNADDMANMIGTIGYEVVCNIGQRVPRLFIDNGTPGQQESQT